jgi:hypothetical protein
MRYNTKDEMQYKYEDKQRILYNAKTRCSTSMKKIRIKIHTYIQQLKDDFKYKYEDNTYRSVEYSQWL